jgi:prepilin-type processing-associated H-X9-DG protein
MKQLGLAQSIYAQDYDETFPKGYHRLPDGSDYPWYLELAPYTRNVAIFRCPSDRNPMRIGPALSPATRKQIVDFSVSIISNYDIMTPQECYPVRMPELEAPAELISLVDMRDIGAFPGWTGYWGVHPFKISSPLSLYGRQLLSGAEVMSAVEAAEAGKTPPGEGAKFGPRVATRRHTGGENYIFADGHAHWMLFRRTLNPATGGTEGSMWMQPLLRTY